MIEVLHSPPTWVTVPLQQSRYYSGINPTPSASPCSRTCAASASTPDRVRTGIGSLITPVPTGSIPCTSPCQNFKDELHQPVPQSKVMRDMKLFAIDDDDLKNYLRVSAIHNAVRGYRLVRNTLSAQYNLEQPGAQISGLQRGGEGRSIPHPALMPHNRIPWASRATRCSSTCTSCGGSM